MTIPDEYLILDTRGKEHFKVQTYSNYLKKDVTNIFVKKILEAEIEAACYWCTELMLSLNFDVIIDKLLMIAIKYVNISEPKLPNYFWSKLEFLISSCKQPNEMRNSQVARNHIIELCVILCTSPKGKPLGLTSQVKNKLDFSNITKHLEANTNYLENVKRADDPEDLSIFMNELGHCIKFKNYEKAIMWLTYIINFDKIIRKSKNKLVVSKRNNTKDGDNVIWYIWELILTLSKVSVPQITLKQIKSLYFIQKLRGYKSSEIFFTIAAIKFNTHNLNFSKSLTNTFSIQATSRVNFLFLEAKQFENNKIDITKHIVSSSVSFNKKPTAKKKKENEKTRNEKRINKQLQQTQMIDTIIQKKQSNTTKTLSNLLDLQRKFY